MTSNVAMQYFRIYKWIYDINDISIFDFIECLESLFWEHHRLLYPYRFIRQEKFWRHLLPYIGTNLQVSIFCLGFLVTKFWPNSICLWKQGKMGKQKQPSERKEYAMQSWWVLIFCFKCTKVSWSPSVNKT